QTVQTLMLVRRGDEARQSLRQARELVALAEMVLQQNGGEFPAQQLTVSLTAPRSETGPAVEAPAVGENRGDDNQSTALITFQRIENPDADQRLTRITATYRP